MPTITIETGNQNPKKVKKVLQASFPEATITACGKNGDDLSLNTTGNPATVQITLGEVLKTNNFLWTGH